MRHIMLDLETLSLQPNATILSIGAVVMDLETGVLGDEFYCTVDPRSCQQWGLHVCADTAIWWMKQSEEVRKAVYEGEALTLQAALARFGMWAAPSMEEEEVKNLRLWGNGAAADNVWLLQAYQATHILPPWKFWTDRCYRTLKAAFRDVPYVEPTIKHHALEDAKAQDQHLINIVGAHGLKLT